MEADDIGLFQMALTLQWEQIHFNSHYTVDALPTKFPVSLSPVSIV